MHLLKAISFLKSHAIEAVFSAVGYGVVRAVLRLFRWNLIAWTFRIIPSNVLLKMLLLIYATIIVAGIASSASAE